MHIIYTYHLLINVITTYNNSVRLTAVAPLDPGPTANSTRANVETQIILSAKEDTGSGWRPGSHQLFRFCFSRLLYGSTVLVIDAIYWGPNRRTVTPSHSMCMESQLEEKEGRNRNKLCLKNRAIDWT